MSFDDVLVSQDRAEQRFHRSGGNGRDLFIHVTRRRPVNLTFDSHMNQQSFTIRPAVTGDAASIGQLAQMFAAYLRDLGDATDFQFDATAFLRDGFGDNPAFDGIVAESNGLVIGYLLYHSGYDTDHAARLIHIIDLYVTEKHRGQGVGRALMSFVAERGRTAGAKRLIWSVYQHNTEAARFYKSLGARYVRDLEFMYLAIE